MSADLVPLAPQPDGVPWPTQHWPRRNEPLTESPNFRRRADALFDLNPARGITYALLVVQGGELIYERYAAGANAFYLQYSWSMAKSITHALVGIAVGRGLLDVAAPAAVPQWHMGDDPRAAITLHHLLQMRSGLAFNEDYVDGAVSDVIRMLNFDGRHDMAAYAAAKPLEHPPGEHFLYSSGTTNIIARILRDVIGDGPSGMLAFMHDALFEPIGMTSALPRFDRAGTFVGSSYCLATPQDFARFGLLYARDGVWDTRRILPPGWVDYARTPSYEDAEQAYGAHWWLRPGSHEFLASGYDGQRIIIDPARDLVMVRCGRTATDQAPYIWDQVFGLAQAFALL